MAYVAPRTMFTRDEPYAFLGAGLGIFSSVYLSEFVARATRVGKPWAQLLKMSIKVLLSILFLGLSVYFGGRRVLSLVFRVMGWSSFGAIVLDVVEIAFPGGISGLSQATAAAIVSKAVASSVSAEKMMASAPSYGSTSSAGAGEGKKELVVSLMT